MSLPQPIAAPFPPPTAVASAATAKRSAVAVLLAWALCSFLYFETANGVRIKESDLHNAWHHYEYLVDGFLQGHLYLSVAPDPQLLALPDPYDPAKNISYRLWDASLYHGKYYLYYGPTPALLLMLPWKAVMHEHMPQRIATAIFASAGLGALALLLYGFAQRHGQIRAAKLFWAVVLVAHISWLPVVLRRPAFWELPIVAAVALFWWSVYFLWRYHAGTQRLGWAVAAGATLGLALGARPTFLFSATTVVVLFGWPFSRGRPWRTWMRGPAVAAIPFGCAILALLWYNYARFGSIFEFGQRYQLWGMEERNVAHFSLKYAPFNAWLYLFSAPEFSPYFPFVRTAWSNDLPSGYIATEEMHGLFLAMPALVLGAAAFCRRFRDDRPVRLLLVAGTATTLFAAAILFCFAGACSRYVLELVAGWSIVAALGFIAALDRTVVPRRWLRVAAFAVTVWSLGYVWLASFEFRAFARLTAPVVYRTLAHTLNYPSYWFARYERQPFGPIAMDVAVVPSPPPGTTVLAASGRNDQVNQLLLVINPDGMAVLRFQTNDVKVVETAPFPLPANHHFSVWFAAPWLYPPEAHPFWDQFTDRGEQRLRLFGYIIHTESRHCATLFTYMFDAMRFEPVVRTADERGDAPAWITSWHHAENPP